MTDAAATARPITAARLREWVATAKPGARLIYATGHSCRAAAGEAVADLVTRLGSGGTGKRGDRIDGLGLVSAHFTRGPNREGQYLVIRTAKPTPRGVVL